MSKETFKIFAKNHPELAQNVMNGVSSWQKLYEIYDIYGEDNKIWNDILNKKQEQTSLTEIFSSLKNIDMDTIQKGVTNIQKTISLIQDIGLVKKTEQPNYEKRPLYKSFED